MEMPGSSDPSQRLDAALKLLGEGAVRLAELEAENVSLRAQLKALRQTPIGAQPLQSDASSSTVAASYDELAKSYRELQDRHTKCRPHIELANRRYREAKEVCRQWRVYCDRKSAEKTTTRSDQASSHQDGVRSKSPPTAEKPTSMLSAEEALRIREAPNPAQSPPNVPANTMDTGDPHGCATPRPLRTGTAATFRGDVDVIAKPVESHSHEVGQMQRPICSSPHAARISSSQTTEAGSDPSYLHSSPPKNHELSSDSEPVVVSARNLKRKAGASVYDMPPPVRVKQEPNSPEKPIEIKSEACSSPVQRRHRILRPETSDLDLLHEAHKTPHKRRVQLRAVSEEASGPPPLSSRDSSLSDDDRPEPAEDQFCDLPQVRSEKTREGAPLFPAVLDHDLGHQTASSHAMMHALRPLSVNVPTAARRFDMAHLTKRRRRSDEQAAAKAAALSEDGEGAPSEQTFATNAISEEKTTPKTYVTRRLVTMLEGPSPDKQYLARNRTPEPVAPRHRKPLTPVSDNTSLSRSMRPEGTLTKQLAGSVANGVSGKHRSREASSRKRVEPRNQTPQGLEESPPPVQPEDEPLRLRVPSALRLEDFKINPKHMGSDFAFADSIRGRDQRRCMQGCTKPDCCGGAFLKAAEMGINVGTAKSDDEVLEAYLGSNWQQVMGAHPRDKRNDLLIRARASAMANQYGKHRQAFERRSTPPGFWRTDMPSTQQAEEDRVKAQQMVRQKVEERWREAMRDGGRWLFRDE